MSRLLLALQYWDGDKQQALRLARFIADLEPVFNSQVEFLFVYRNDSSIDQPTVDYVSKKFKTHTFRSDRIGVHGWPYGCNEVWFSLAHHAFLNFRDGGKYSNCKAFLSFEADCVPLTRDWIKSLSDGWDKAGKVVMGAWGEFEDPRRTGGGVGHINGNALFAIDIAIRIPELIGCPANRCWDAYFGKQFKSAGWEKTNLIVNNYRRLNYTSEDYDKAVAAGTVFLHGVKDDSAFGLARGRLLA